MCLFPFMMADTMQPVVPPTPKGQKYKSILQIMTMVHLIFSVLLLFVNLFTGLSQLISTMILWCAASQMHYCYLLFYIILQLLQFVKQGCFIGLTIQDNIFRDMFKYNAYDMTVTFLFTIFCLISIIISFYAYREFKGMFYDSIGSMGGRVPMMPGTSSYQRNRR